MVAECADDDNIFTADDPKPAHLATYKSYLYSPGSFVPLAQLLGKGRQSEIYYYLNDHLGTPQELVNGKGQIAWSAAYRAYGNLAVAFVESVPQPLRFQGQYFDAESGLHYNRYRYYPPETARFITPDPIGLAGGLNQTQYVPNPTGWVDPLGLASVPGGCPPDTAEKTASAVNLGEPDIPTVELNPNEVRYSQSSVNNAGGLTKSMNENGWKGDPIDVVRMSDGGLTTIDNTRVLAASRTNVNVQARVHDGNSPLPTEFIERFTTKKGVPVTWEDAIMLRIGKQNSGYRNTYPNGSPIIGSIE